jgi:UDP-N-acetylmuramoyl-tripeptide--D-alanyl-D-alanine ligase
MNIERLYELFKQNPSVQTDTRKLKKGDIFFALKGDRFNGNNFAKQALEAGASLAVIDEKEFAEGDSFFLVEDALKALQELAAHHRKQFDIPFIAITGSNGKTTTKELVHAVLSTAFKTYTTEGNLNNHIGVPLTIFKIKPDAEMAVIEMGANHIGEIASYCKIAQPDHGLITNCGKAHLEGFGSEEGVRKGKGELFDHLRGLTHGFAFVNWDYEYLREMSKGISGIIKYGTGPEVHVSGKVLKNDPLLSVQITQGSNIHELPTQLVGEYNLPNVLAAVTIGSYFNVPASSISAAISSYTPSNSRSQLISRGSNKIILDAYNANPSSMKLAIENFSRMEGERKILVLGAMAELGNASIKEHERVIEQINEHKWDGVVLVGGDFNQIKHSYKSFSSAEEAMKWFKTEKITGAHFLIKGSRSVAMEKIVEGLEN